jgi:endonuclease/exonuclease/phosphatase family metal-dependent hydrolase
VDKECTKSVQTSFQFKKRWKQKVLKIVTYNIQFGRGRDGKVNLDRIVAALDGADIIALQEVDRYWPRSGDKDQVSLIVEKFPGFDFAYGPGVDQAITGKVGTDGRPRRRQFGNLLISRYPIGYVRHHLLPKFASIGPFSIQRSALECAIQTECGPIRFYSLHLTHLSAETRMPQVRALLRLHGNAQMEGAPVCGGVNGSYWDEGAAKAPPPDAAILLGDFNFQPSSGEYDELVGPLSPFGGRVTHPLGFVDGWEMVGGGEDTGYTSNLKGEPVRIDYAFISASLRDRIRSCWVDHDADGSDHQPLWIDVT